MFSNASRLLGLVFFFLRSVGCQISIAQSKGMQVYKLYVRPHLDYGDIIYHKYDPQMCLSFTQKLEQTQYSAALAVSGAWRGTNRQRLYEELGWESLYHRRWYRRLCHFFKLLLSQSPGYLYNEIPPERQIGYNLRNAHDYEIHAARTNRYANTYFYNTLYEWNLLGEEMKISASLPQFKSKLLNIIRPKKNQRTIFVILRVLDTSLSCV